MERDGSAAAAASSSAAASSAGVTVHPISNSAPPPSPSAAVAEYRRVLDWIRTHPHGAIVAPLIVRELHQSFELSSATGAMNNTSGPTRRADLLVLHSLPWGCLNYVRLPFEMMQLQGMYSRTHSNK